MVEVAETTAQFAHASEAHGALGGVARVTGRDRGQLTITYLKQRSTQAGFMLRITTAGTAVCKR